VRGNKHLRATQHQQQRSFNNRAHPQEPGHCRPQSATRLASVLSLICHPCNDCRQLFRPVMHTRTSFTPASLQFTQAPAPWTAHVMHASSCPQCAAHEALTERYARFCVYVFTQAPANI
jgi:hypothetical protein